MKYIDINHDSILRAKPGYLQMDLNTKFARIAHVYGNDTDFAKGRQMHSLFADMPVLRSVFHDIESAREWLNIPADYVIDYD